MTRVAPQGREALRHAPSASTATCRASRGAAGDLPWPTSAQVIPGTCWPAAARPATDHHTWHDRQGPNLRDTIPQVIAPIDLQVPPLATLHTRRSMKWDGHPSDVLAATVAEMDFPVAAPITAALHAAIDRHDLGYAQAHIPRLAEALSGFAPQAEVAGGSRAGPPTAGRDGRYRTGAAARWGEPSGGVRDTGLPAITWPTCLRPGSWCRRSPCSTTAPSTSNG